MKQILQKARSAHAADDSSDVMIAEDFPAMTFGILPLADDVARSPLSFDSSGEGTISVSLP